MFFIAEKSSAGWTWITGKRGPSLTGDRGGQTLVEYALIIAFISVVAISVLISLGSTVKGTFSKVTSELQSAQSSH